MLTNGTIQWNERVREIGRSQREAEVLQAKVAEQSAEIERLTKVALFKEQVAASANSASNEQAARITELEALNGALCRDNADMKQERDALAAQVEVMRDALTTVEGWIIVPKRNCPCHISPPCSNCVDKSNAEFDDEMVKAAISLPDLSAEILHARDARVLRDAADRLESHDFVMNSSGKWYAEASELRKLADDLEQKK